MNEATHNPSGGEASSSPAGGDAGNPFHIGAEGCVDPKPLAAYRLGFGIFAVWFWHEVFWKLRDEEATWGNVTLALARLRSAMNALFVEIHPNVFADLDRAVTDFAVKTRRLTDLSPPLKGEDRDDDSTIFETLRREWEALKGLADQALDVSRELRSLYDFGASLGELRLNLWDWGPGSILDKEALERYQRWVEAGASDPVPDMRPLVRAAMRLPQNLVRHIPYIESLVLCAPQLESTERPLYLKTFLDRHKDLCRWYDARGEIDHSIISTMVDALDCAIEAGLETFNAEIKTPLPLQEEIAPSWNEITGEFIYGSFLIKKYAEHAWTVRMVLDKFQSENWKKKILSPFHEDEFSARLKEAQRILNSKQKLIRFRRSKPNHISWK